MSLECLGRVDIDGLRLLWYENGEYMNRFTDFPTSPEVKMVNDQFYKCVPGTEYLVAHPLRVPGLDELVESCTLNDGERSNVVFAATRSSDTAEDDLFASLSPELRLDIMLRLPREDVATLRLASLSFQQLPQKYFNHLVRSEMPWVWEIESLQGKHTDWHALWCRLSAADGGSGTDAAERNWLEKADYPLLPREDPIDGLTDVERMMYGLGRVSWRKRDLSQDEEEAALKAVAEIRPHMGRMWPKSTELKGLRNRRRIYEDIVVILRWISYDRDADVIEDD